MRKITALLLIAVLAFSSAPVFAESPEEAKRRHYEEMKQVKDRQRQEREGKKKAEEAGQPAEPSEMSKFWKKEGERSGLGDSGERMGTFFQNLNPVPFFKEQQEKYNARKTASTNQ